MSFVTSNGINHRAFNLLPGYSGAAAGDPFWSSVTMLLNLQYINNTTITDSSTAAHVVTGVNPQPCVTNSDFVTGWPAGYGSIFRPAVCADFNRLASLNNFTIEAWLKAPAAFAGSPYKFSFGAFTPVDLTFFADQSWAVTLSDQTGAPTDLFPFPNTYPLNSWFHIAIVRNGNSILFFLNGASAGSDVFSSLLGDVNTIRLNAGTVGLDGYTLNIGGYRVTNAARYTAPFTPPTAPFPVGA